ncbi:secretion HlyD family domain protein [Synechococcus sp. M16.1]|nr:secretion HlyD family domain protein [Synechococcus sp. M16.1]
MIKSSQDALERFFQEREDEGEVIQQSSKWVKGTIWSLMGTATFAVSWLAIAKTD